MAPGTVEWAGGMINWQDPDYTASGGQFYALVKSVSIKCGGGETSAPGNTTSYTYGSNVTTNTPSVALSNDSTMLNGAVSEMVGVSVAGGVWAMVGGVVGSMVLGLLI